MPAAEDQNPVQAFGPDRAYPPFGECVRSRSPDRVLTMFTPSSGVTIDLLPVLREKA